jgi:uncharacterized protein
MMADEPMRRLFASVKTIAVVGMSEKPERDSHQVGAYLQGVGYRIVPVNPTVSEVLRLRSYPSLRDIPSDVHIDLVDVFRHSDAVPGIVDEALARQPLPKAVWLQLGVKDDASGERLRGAGVGFVQDSCIRVQHRRLLGY